MDWTDSEFANLRPAFRRANERGELSAATAIAAHAAIMVWPIQRFEPVDWALEILDAVVAAEIPQLPRLEVAASLCLYLGEPDRGVTYTPAATALAADARYDPFEDGWSEMLESLAHLFGGRIERRVEICADLAARTGFARVVGLCGLTWALPAVGRADEAKAIADEALDAARQYGNPFWIGWALGGYGRAVAEARSAHALAALREGSRYARETPARFLGGQSRPGRGSPRKRVTVGSATRWSCSPRRSIRSTGPATSCSWQPRWRRWRSVRPLRASRGGRRRLRRQHPTGQHRSRADPRPGDRASPFSPRRGKVRGVGRRGFFTQETAEAVRFAQLQIERIVDDVAA